MDSAKSRGFWGRFFFAILSFLLPAGVVLVTIVTVGILKQDLLTKPEVQLPIVLIATVLAIVGGLAFLVIVLNYLGLTTRRAALGMPEGSIRAVIAISLLFLFMILSVFLYANLTGPGASDGAKAAGVDVAKQLVTTVATLAVSVAGFYFGTSSVAAAARAVGGVRPLLSLLSPQSPQKLAKTAGTELRDIRVVANPPGQALTWTVAGDDVSSLLQVQPGVFVYRRGVAPADKVILTFGMANYPDAKAVLEIDPA